MVYFHMTNVSRGLCALDGAGRSGHMRLVDGPPLHVKNHSSVT